MKSALGIALVAILLMVLNACGRMCGSPPKTSTPGTPTPRAIVNGQPNRMPQDAAVVLLTSFPKGKQYAEICTATLVAPDLLLTAGHCLPGVHSIPANTPTYIYLGSDLNRSSSPQANDPNWIEVTEVMHDDPLPDYAELEAKGTNGTTRMPFKDLGMVRIARPLEATPYPVGFGLVRSSGARVRLAGYGAGKDDGTEGGVKRTAPASILDLIIDPSTRNLGVIDIGISRSGDRTACQGDSGGPAFLTVNGREHVIGTVAGGPTPCRHSYFSSVDNSRAFIERELARSRSRNVQSGSGRCGQ